MRVLIAIAVGLLASTTSAQAQSTITSRTIGSTTYHSGYVDGEYVSGTTRDIGNQSYSNLRVGSQTLSGHWAPTCLDPPIDVLPILRLMGEPGRV